MIPTRMHTFLQQAIPELAWNKRLIKDAGRCYFEFSALDIDSLRSLGIEVDNLGPRSVVCMWDENSLLEVGGYLVVDNLAMGQPAMGGIRMLPDITPQTIHNLARGMTLKNAAANLPYGGGKAGIVAERSLTPAEHTEVVRLFARLLYRYHSVYLPGPDVGTNDADMKTIAIENGLDNALSKPGEMGGSSDRPAGGGRRRPGDRLAGFAGGDATAEGLAAVCQPGNAGLGRHNGRHPGLWGSRRARFTHAVRTGSWRAGAGHQRCIGQPL